MKTISATLRQAIDESGQTLYRVAKDAGISYGMLYHFYHGQRDMRLSTIEKLAAHFRLELKPSQRKDGK